MGNHLDWTLALEEGRVDVEEGAQDGAIILQVDEGPASDGRATVTLTRAQAEAVSRALAEAARATNHDGPPAGLEWSVRLFNCMHRLGLLPQGPETTEGEFLDRLEALRSPSCLMPRGSRTRALQQTKSYGVKTHAELFAWLTARGREGLIFETF